MKGKTTPIADFSAFKLSKPRATTIDQSIIGRTYTDGDVVLQATSANGRFYWVRLESGNWWTSGDTIGEEFVPCKVTLKVEAL